MRQVGIERAACSFMKTYKNLYSKMIAFNNLLCAAHQAARGKREQENVLRFFNRLEENLLALQEALQSQTYQPGAYSTFQIYEPKPRMIIPPLRDVSRPCRAPCLDQRHRLVVRAEFYIRFLRQSRR